MSQVSGDWNSWPRYRDLITAIFCAKDIYRQIEGWEEEPPDIPTFTYISGHWSVDGDPLPQFPWEQQGYTKKQYVGNLILLECLPPSMYEQVMTCQTVRKKWRRLHELYEEYKASTHADAAADPPTPNAGLILPSGQTHPSAKANNFLLDSLRRYPKYGDSYPGATDPRPTIFEHLSFMQVIYEGLVLRDAEISEGEFINMIRATLSKLPMFQAFVTMLNTQAKKQGRPNVPICELIEGIAGYEEAFGEENVVLILQE